LAEKANAARVVRSCAEAEALGEAYALLARIAERARRKAADSPETSAA